jgi:hypothetical protein
MKMSFLPGELELFEEDGSFVVSIKGEILMRTRSQKAAVVKFNSVRRSLEETFPYRDRPPTAEEMRALLASILNDAAIDATLRRPPKKRSTARSSRTFGG